MIFFIRRIASSNLAGSDPKTNSHFSLSGGGSCPRLQDGRVINARVKSASDLIKHLSELEREWQEPITLDSPDEELAMSRRHSTFPLRSINLVCIKTVPYLYERLGGGVPPAQRAPSTYRMVES